MVEYKFVKNKDLPANKHLKEVARDLRKAGNEAEILLWKQLRRKQLCNLDFDRQRIIGSFIVDFYCPEKRVIIEIDGGSHIGKEKEDKTRDEILQSLNLRVLRVSDIDVKTKIGEVLERIEDFINEIK